MHRCWKVSDRVSVFQLSTNQKEYECVSDENGINLKLQVKKSYICKPVATSNTRVKFCRKKIKYCITIVNVYAPHTLRVKDDPTELDQLYTEVANVMNNIKRDRNTSATLLLTTGDFNAKIGKRKDGCVWDRSPVVKEIRADRCLSISVVSTTCS